MSGGFVMFPDWLRRKKPSGNAYIIYVALGSFGTFNPGSGRYEQCRPSLKRLTEETGLPRSVVKRALAELITIGAAERVERTNRDGSSAPTLYRLIFGVVQQPKRDAPAGRGPGADLPQTDEVPQRTPGGPGADPNQEPSTKNHSSLYEPAAEAPGASGAGAESERETDREQKPPKPRVPRPRRSDPTSADDALARLGASVEERAALIPALTRDHSIVGVGWWINSFRNGTLAGHLQTLRDAEAAARAKREREAAEREHRRRQREDEEQSAAAPCKHGNPRNQGGCDLCTLEEVEGDYDRYGGVLPQYYPRHRVPFWDQIDAQRKTAA